MKILIVGNGGREHALAWKCAQSGGVEAVLVAPGNAGTALEAGITNVDIAAEDVEGLLEFAKSGNIDLTIVGPEVPLVGGIVDRFEASGLACFGPNQAAAQLEGSKDFSKQFMHRHGIPTARYATFTDLEEAKAYIRDVGAPIVVKADGLAAGKGVVVADSLEEALAAADDMLAAERFGAAGQRIVVEEFLAGEEASFIVIADGQQVVPLATSQDHKARDEGDSGPNTGGMGAYSPAPVVTPALEARIMADVIRPTLAGLAADGIHYRGFLYAGLMIAPDGTPNVLEFNCRFGDPETQPIMMRMASDLVSLCQAAIDGRLADECVEWDERAAVGVVMTAGGYPLSYAKGHTISGLNRAEQLGAKVFHAGTNLDDGAVVTSGGRVLCVVGLGASVSSARETAYAGVGAIRWVDEYHRNDIAHRAVGRE
ncbi:MAG: phosphoribosylamine--glycine ligase [Pseudomonadota bacterium]